MASPWTLPRGTLVLSSSFDFQFADTEFIDRGGERAFPLEGQFFGGGMTLSARLGVTDELEIEGSIPIRFVGYTSDPIILRTPPGGSGDLGFFQANVVDFSQTGAGVGDIAIRGRYRFLTSRLVAALQLSIITPTGYEEPAGTFGREPTTVAEFEQAVDQIVSPENVQDDVVLGDGVLELEAALLAGLALDTGTFVRASAGYALRLGGAGDQLRADVRAGQAVDERVLLFVSTRLALTVESGDLIGITVVARNPEESAADLTQNQQLRLVPRPLERDALDVGGGLVWRMTADVELNLSYERTVWGRFTAATHVAALTFLFRTDT